MTNNSFKQPDYCDHTIQDQDDKTVGHIRIKASTVLWKPSRARQWFGVPLDDFIKFIQENGKKQDH